MAGAAPGGCGARVEAELAKKRQVRKPAESVPEQSPEQNESQRAMQVATSLQDRGEAREKAAATVGVNPKYVTDAKRIARVMKRTIWAVRTILSGCCTMASSA